MVELDNLKKLTKELSETFTNIDYPIINLLQKLFENIHSQVMILDKNDYVIYLNNVASKNMNAVFDIKDIAIGKKLFPIERIIPAEKNPSQRAIKTKKVVAERFVSPFTKKSYNIISIPLAYNGTFGTINICEEVDVK